MWECLKDLNSYSFEFTSNEFELVLGVRSVQNLEIFGRALIKAKRIRGKVWRPNLNYEID